MRIVQYQVGVDVLGFPIYEVHYISQHKGKQDKRERIITGTKIIKQH